ncbi:MAG: hypothetical protein Q9167_003244 [Letrouitia subvulpina]
MLLHSILHSIKATTATRGLPASAEQKSLLVGSRNYVKRGIRKKNEEEMEMESLREMARYFLGKGRLLDEWRTFVRNDSGIREMEREQVSAGLG